MTTQLNHQQLSNSKSCTEQYISYHSFGNIFNVYVVFVFILGLTKSQFNKWITTTGCEDEPQQEPNQTNKLFILSVLNI